MAHKACAPAAEIVTGKRAVGHFVMAVKVHALGLHRAHIGDGRGQIGHSFSAGLHKTLMVQLPILFDLRARLQHSGSRVAVGAGNVNVFKGNSEFLRQLHTHRIGKPAIGLQTVHGEQHGLVAVRIAKCDTSGHQLIPLHLGKPGSGVAVAVQRHGGFGCNVGLTVADF